MKQSSERGTVLRMDDQERPYGEELMRDVASHLFGGLAIAAVHRDYCGVGLFCDDGGVYAAEVYDGAPGAPLMRWASQKDFVDFFAQQSDASMGRGPGSPPEFAVDDPWRHGNQTLTRDRFERFLRQAASGDATKASSLVPPEAPFALVLEEVLDKRALLTFLRDELGYQLKVANTLLANLPFVLFGLESQEAGAEQIEAFARSGGRCSVIEKGRRGADRNR